MTAHQGTRPPPLFGDKGGSAWALLQERTDVYLDPLGRAAMALLQLERGTRVVDVGCGCGQTLLELAELVGPSGEVLGLDISEPMLARARERVAAHENVSLALADAETYPFGPRSWDALFSRFGVMFFRDPQEAFTNLRRALRPHGQLAFVCWQELARNPWADIPLRAVMARSPDTTVPGLLEPGAPGPFAFADRDGLEALLSAAGYAEVRIAPHTTSVHFGAALTVDEAVDYCRQLGPAARFLAEAPAERHPELLATLREALAPHMTPRGLWMDAATWLVSTRNPG
ncbi:MAG TPA: methyltransferase domain-containing protein [Polyangia bacterium]|jgi:SAM-dependent methyltransferase|nr:methyltransferase domain-containing protein [Polyangia bacterium]